ncbi:MAG: hypothetical protein JSS34_08175 [Proteobacteria bacterium]|nr:hypothetical protein [Pseudomonadota bacterium]
MRHLLYTFVTYVLIGMFAFHPISATPIFKQILENFPPEERQSFSAEKRLVRVSFLNHPQEDFYLSQPQARRFLNIDIHGNPLKEKEKEEKFSSIFFEISNRVQWILKIQEQAVVGFLREAWQDITPEEVVRFSDLVTFSSDVAIPENLKTSDFSDAWISQNRSFITWSDYGLIFKRKETQTSFSPLVRMMLPVLPGNGCPDLSCLTRLFISSLLLNSSSSNFLDFEETFQRKEDGRISYESRSLLDDFLNQGYDYRAVEIPENVCSQFQMLSSERLVLSLFINPWTLKEGRFRFSTLLNLEGRIRVFQKILKENSVLTLEGFFRKAMPEVAIIYHETYAQPELRQARL